MNGFIETPQETLKKISELVEYDELTVAIYRLGVIVISEIVPDELSKYPMYGYTDEQEHALLLRLAELQSSKDKNIRNEYQQI